MRHNFIILKTIFQYRYKIKREDEMTKSAAVREKVKKDFMEKVSTKLKKIIENFLADKQNRILGRGNPR